MLAHVTFEIPVYGQKEQSAHDGHFEFTCYHPLLLFSREGDCLAATPRPEAQTQLAESQDGRRLYI